MIHGLAAWRPVAPPLAFAVVAALLTRFITDRPEAAAAMARGIAGPTTWPTMMLYAVVLLALGWAVQRVAQVLRAGETDGAAPPTAPLARGGVQVWLGIVLALAYGFSLPVLGFALATLLFIALWLLVGGIRSPLQVGLTSIIGTVVFLYVFVKLTSMPLDKGAGVIGEFSIALYRWMRIY